MHRELEGSCLKKLIGESWNAIIRVCHLEMDIGNECCKDGLRREKKTTCNNGSNFTDCDEVCTISALTLPQVNNFVPISKIEVLNSFNYKIFVMMLNFPILPTKISHLPNVTYKMFLGGVAPSKPHPRSSGQEEKITKDNEDNEDNGRQKGR